MKQYISILNGIDSKYHRSPIIIHCGMWYIAEFKTIEQLDFFAKLLGFTYKLIKESKWLNTEMEYREYSISHNINGEHNYFWKLSDLPTNVKPIKALSNGSIVTCYFVNDGETITIYRPNPNAKEVYKPLSFEEHLAHNKVYGFY